MPCRQSRTFGNRKCRKSSKMSTIILQLRYRNLYCMNRAWYVILDTASPVSCFLQGPSIYIRELSLNISKTHNPSDNGNTIHVLVVVRSSCLCSQCITLERIKIPKMRPNVIKSFATGVVAPLQKSSLHAQASYLVLLDLPVLTLVGLQSPSMYSREQSLTTSENT